MRLSVSATRLSMFGFLIYTLALLDLCICTQAQIPAQAAMKLQTDKKYINSITLLFRFRQCYKRQPCEGEYADEYSSEYEKYGLTDVNSHNAGKDNASKDEFCDVNEKLARLDQQHFFSFLVHGCKFIVFIAIRQIYGVKSAGL